VADKFTINIGNKKIVIDAKSLKDKEIKSSLSNDKFINTVFNAYDTNGEKGLQKKEINNLIKDLKKAAGKDKVLTEEEGKSFLSSLGLEISDNAKYGEFIEHIGNLANAAASGTDENGKTFTRQTSISDKGVITRIDNYEDGTYQKYENNKLVSGKDEKGDYQITEYTFHSRSLGDVKAYKTYTNADKSKEIYDKNGKLIRTEDKDGKILDYTHSENKIRAFNTWGQVVNEVETLDNGKTITKEYTYSHYDGIQECVTTDENGVKTKTTTYLDNYLFNHAKSGVGMCMKDLKKILKPEITDETLESFKFYGDRLAETLANMPDNFDKEKYMTGIIDKLDEYAKLANVSTKELDNIKSEIKSKGFDNVPVNDIVQSYQTVFSRFEKADLKINNNDQISNSYYKSDNSYTKYVTNNNNITIIDDKTGEKTTLNISKMTGIFNTSEQKALQAAISGIPAECLLDLKTEVSFSNKPMVFPDSDGEYLIDTDKIYLRGGDYSKETLVHELGHAIDAKGKSGFWTDSDKAFIQAFDKEMKAYEAQGGQRVYNDTLGITLNYNADGSNYATLDRQEMFAECYAMLMLGDNKSEETIKKYFPETLEAAKNLLNKIRQQPDSVRHSS